MNEQLTEHPSEAVACEEVTCTCDRKAILSKVFPSLSEEDLTYLASVAECRTYPAGTVLCREGGFEDTFYVIVDGAVEVTKQLDGQASLTVNRIASGGFFGELALLQAEPRSATVTTVKPSTMLLLSREAFRRALHANASMAIQVLMQIAKRLRDADQRTIQKLRAKNRELARAYAELEEQERLRSEFLTTVSHELRTPLTAAIGYIQLISSGAVPPDQMRPFIETAERNLRTVVRLVNNILFLQEMEMITPRFEPLDIGALVGRAVKEREEAAAQNALHSRLEIEPNLPPVMGDTDSLGRAIGALLDNAIKFSPDGGEITVRVRRRDDEIHITVRDPGVGFPMERLDDLFKPFVRLEPPEGRLFGGIGVGLPIAKHVIQMHGGHIEVESQVGAGSTFTIVLPAASST